MCGIVGIIAKTQVAPSLVHSLRRLEYRGYDSAGIATIENGYLARRRADGKLKNLEMRLAKQPLRGRIGIGHTRWATHGAPSERNAHPHISDGVAVVHNGIIENFRELRSELTQQGYIFSSDTDTEVIAHLVTHELKSGHSPEAAVQNALQRLVGAFALAIIFAGHDDLIIAARRGSPLAIGYGDGEMYLGSDAIALAPFTNRITYLEDGDWAVITGTSVEFRDMSGVRLSRPILNSVASSLLVDKGNYRHFMLKEIGEQPEVISHTLAGYLDMISCRVKFPDLPVDLAKISRVTISACGTAHYAGQIAKYWLERYARLPVEIDVASEFRYREVPIENGGLALFVTQSGETADTLAALRYCKSMGQHVASIVNVPTSTIARESDVVLPTVAGAEIGVASTKAFTCQLAVLAAFALEAGRSRGVISEAKECELVTALVEVPRHISRAVRDQAQYEALAQWLSKASDVLYLGRGISYPLALEGALKLKEISYIHAEGYAAGELKHGPIALIDEHVPVIVVAPKDDLFEKTVSNMQEVAARGGRIVAITDADPEEIGCKIEGIVKMPTVHPFVVPLLYAVPLQLLAYHTAVVMGMDVDQPRNLAKSVTVE